MFKEHSERTDGCAAGQFGRLASAGAIIMRQVKQSKGCSSLRIQVLLATLASINLLKTRHICSATAFTGDGDQFRVSLSQSALMDDQLQIRPHALGDSDDELSKTMARGIISASPENQGENLSLSPPPQYVADLDGSGRRDLQQAAAASGPWSASSTLGHQQRAAIVRNEFGDQAESSELAQQISSMLVNQTSSEKYQSFPVRTIDEQTDFAKLSLSRSGGSKSKNDEFRDKNITIPDFRQHNATHDSSGFSDMIESTAYQMSHEQSMKMKKKERKRQKKIKRLPFEHYPLRTANQSRVEEGPNRMVAYVSSQTSRIPDEQPPSEWRNLLQGQSSMNSPLQSVQFSGGWNMHNLLPNYRQVFSSNNEHGQIQLIPTYKAKNAAISTASETFDSQLPSQQTEVAASSPRGPFELEQLQASSSSLDQRAKPASSNQFIMRNSSEPGTEGNSSSRESTDESTSTGFPSSVVVGDNREESGMKSNEDPDEPDEESDESENQTPDLHEPSTSSAKSGHHSSRSLPSDNEFGSQKTPQGPQDGRADADSSSSSSSRSSSNEMLMVQRNRFTEHKMDLEPQNGKSASSAPSGTEQKRLNETGLDEGHRQSRHRQVTDTNVNQVSMPLPHKLAGSKPQTQELLVGPFKSEAEAPATITLAGIVYQKSGSSSALIRARQIPNERQYQSLSGPLTSIGVSGRQVGTDLPYGTSSLSHQRAQGTGLWPIQEHSIDTGLQQDQPVYLDSAQQAGHSTNTQATIFRVQPANGLRFASFAPFAAPNLLSTSGNQNHLSLTPQQEGSLIAPSGELTLSSSNSKPTRSKTNSLQPKDETTVSSLTGSSSKFLTTSGLLNYSPADSIAHQLGQRPTSDGAPSTTVWTIGKVSSSMSSEEAAPQQLLSSLLIQEAPVTSTNGGSGETLAQTSSNNHSSQLDLDPGGQASDSKGQSVKHAPIVIVQKDVKPVKYHLLRAYLKLRRLLRPFEATYVFPNESGGGEVAGSFLGRRQLRLGRFSRSKRVAH